jgi:ATP-dependent RNA helicase DeaD
MPGHTRTPEPQRTRLARGRPLELAPRLPPARADKGPAAEDGVWFRVNVGRSRNADPRWLLPLLCRRGQVSKPEIGKIRILAAETHFQVARRAAQRFGRAAQRPDEKDPQIHIAEL